MSASFLLNRRREQWRKHLISQRAKNSFYDIRPVEKQVSEIAELIDKKYLLGDIIYSVEDVLEKLDELDVNRIKFKYFGKNSNPPVEVNRYYYFRVAALPKKMSKYFEDVGVNDTYFEEEYFKVGVVREALAHAVKEEEKIKNYRSARLREVKKRKEAEVANE